MHIHVFVYKIYFRHTMASSSASSASSPIIIPENESGNYDIRVEDWSKGKKEGADWLKVKPSRTEASVSPFQKTTTLERISAIVRLGKGLAAIRITVLSAQEFRTFNLALTHRPSFFSCKQLRVRPDSRARSHRETRCPFSSRTVLPSQARLRAWPSSSRCSSL